ncbi:MAG: S41 family peptidase [Pyrinomonadaceae bacterium]
MNKLTLTATLTILLAFGLTTATSAQTSLSFEKDRHKAILKEVHNTVKKNYYDPTFRGINIDGKYAEAVARIDKAESIGQLNVIIAAFLDDFDDSHLFFIPPGKMNKTDYGFNFRAYGNRCYVTKVKVGSDAAKKGLSVGDALVGINGYAVTRDLVWKLSYYFFILRPQPALKLKVLKVDGSQAEYVVTPNVTAGKQLTDLTDDVDFNSYLREEEDSYDKEQRQYTSQVFREAFIWRMPNFMLDPERVDGIVAKAKKFPAMIIDVRGNGGGRVDTVARVIGNLFPTPVKLFDEKKRKGTKEVMAKPIGKDAYAGKIVVLIDSSSASGAEILARVIQLEKRGVVLGDRSEGAVMESLFFPDQVGIDVVVPFGTSVTVADLVMSDGKSIEKVGVEPDEHIIPTATDLAAKRDPVLARAAAILGYKLTPEEAGKVFPVDYR